VFLEWALTEDGLLPKVRSQVSVSRSQSEEHSLDVISGGSGVSDGTSVAIVHSSEG